MTIIARFTVAFMLTFLFGCQAYHGDNYKAKRIRFSRSTTYKELVWTRSYYSDKRIKSKTFIYDRKACFSYTLYYKNEKIYYNNGKRQQTFVDKGLNQTTRQYFTNGKLKSKSIKFVAANLIDTIDIRQVYSVKTMHVDSISRKKTWTVKMDTLILTD